MTPYDDVDFTCERCGEVERAIQADLDRWVKNKEPLLCEHCWTEDHIDEEDIEKYGP